MILLIDNYDSFVHNLARHFRRLGQETLVLRNDEIDAASAVRMSPRAVVLSPGPCTPAEAGCSAELVHRLAADVPILGVCLGHQAIGAALGARIVRARSPRHGRTSRVAHDGTPLFAGIPSPFTACRYHSLVIDEATLPADLRVTARADDGSIMAIEHRTRPLFGVQFHPESVLTEHGYQLLANFLRLAGLAADADPAKLAASENRTPRPTPYARPARPVTF